MILSKKLLLILGISLLPLNVRAVLLPNLPRTVILQMTAEDWIAITNLSAPIKDSYLMSYADSLGNDDTIFKIKEEVVKAYFDILCKNFKNPTLVYDSNCSLYAIGMDKEGNLVVIGDDRRVKFFDEQTLEDMNEDEDWNLGMFDQQWMPTLAAATLTREAEKSPNGELTIDMPGYRVIANHNNEILAWPADFSMLALAEIVVIIKCAIDGQAPANLHPEWQRVFNRLSRYH